MKTENENQIELENSDSFNQALREQDEKTERGKNLITDIAMTCGNDFTVIDGLMEILELFSIKDSGVMVGDLVEDLQSHLFIWTKEYGEGFSQWKESVLTGKKYPNAPDAKMQNSQTTDIARQISGLLNNEDVPEQIRDALTDGLLDLYNSHIDQSKFIEHQKSPEYVEQILCGCSPDN